MTDVFTTVQIKIFAGYDAKKLQNDVNKWTVEQKGKIKVVSTHFSTSSENAPSRFGSVTLITQYSAAIFYEELL